MPCHRLLWWFGESCPGPGLSVPWQQYDLLIIVVFLVQFPCGCESI